MRRYYDSEINLDDISEINFVDLLAGLLANDPELLIGVMSKYSPPSQRINLL